ncbi:hypothetical protein BDB00DRAFT_940905 [Zychaea mexicana]|uniref:uncharacterized protein n=1 Tax=Zychaea mexicana TaxID=64656 RepID=UPI0022FEF42C|nr:uncharacterized protein BDB00DRAFT_940905 [Zychaea mexicana]KAI9490607.1 hypothetical protein BDB00DRAFT_940905 [Zychaea mexicana]
MPKENWGRDMNIFTNYDDKGVTSQSWRTRAKAEAWELAFYTPAGYMAALCHGDRNLEAIARLRCTGYDTQGGYLRFEPAAPSSSADGEVVSSATTSNDHFVITHNPPSSLKLICAQWPCPPTAEDQTLNIPIVWSPGVYQQRLDGDQGGEAGQIQFSIVGQQWGDNTFCNQCRTMHRPSNDHPSYSSSNGNNDGMKIRFQSALVTFEWLQQGLQYNKEEVF